MIHRKKKAMELLKSDKIGLAHCSIKLRKDKEVVRTALLAYSGNIRYSLLDEKTNEEIEFECWKDTVRKCKALFNELPTKYFKEENKVKLKELIDCVKQAIVEDMDEIPEIGDDAVKQLDQYDKMLRRLDEDLDRYLDMITEKIQKERDKLAKIQKANDEFKKLPEKRDEFCKNINKRFNEFNFDTSNEEEEEWAL